VAIATLTVTTDIQSAAVRLNVPIIGVHPCRFRRKPSFWPTLNDEYIGREISAAVHCRSSPPQVNCLTDESQAALSCITP
jgi:hypothetical protein